MTCSERIGSLEDVAGAALEWFINLTSLGIFAKGTDESDDGHVGGNRWHHLLINDNANIAIFYPLVLQRFRGVLVCSICDSTGRITTRYHDMTVLSPILTLQSMICGVLWETTLGGNVRTAIHWVTFAGRDVASRGVRRIVMVVPRAEATTGGIVSPRMVGHIGAIAGIFILDAPVDRCTGGEAAEIIH